MRVVCPFTELHPRTRRSLRGVGAEFWDVSGSDSAYWSLLERLWQDGRPFIVVEHDLEPTREQLLELAECPVPVCSFAYEYGASRPVSALGCTKFGPAALERELTWRFRWSVLAHDQKPHWRDACAYLLSQLPQAHVHEGLVRHHGAR